jgi:hypothetical protein
MTGALWEKLNKINAQIEAIRQTEAIRNGELKTAVEHRYSHNRTYNSP